MVAINGAESNRAQLIYIGEAVWGTTPSSGVARKVRLTSSGILPSKETQTSDEIRSDRMVPSIVEVSSMTSGPIEGEFSMGTYDDWFADFLLSSWSKSMNRLLIKGASVTVTDTSEITVTGTDWTDYLTANQYIKLEGFLNNDNNGYFKIDAVAFTAGDTVITVDETSLVAEAGSAFTKLIDANDVILKSTAVTFTSGNVIDGGAGAFTGQNLQVGQRIYVEGLGKATGTITVDAADTTNGSTFTINDGVDALIFEINATEGAVQAGNVFVTNSATEATLAANISAAVNNQFRRRNFRVSAEVSGAVVTLTNHRATGGSITDTITGITAANFSGGSATKSGFFTIASLPDADTIVVTETLSTDANAGSLPVVIKGSHVRNPSNVADITKNSISVETGYTDVNKYFLADGLRIGSFEMNVSAGEIVTLSWEFMGADTTNSSVTTLGNTSTYTVLEAPDTEVLNATSNVGALVSDGEELTTAIRSFSFTANASLREQPAVGVKTVAGIGYGRMTINGEMQAYFEDFDFFNKFLDHTTTSLRFGFTDADSLEMAFTIPAIKLTTNDIAPGGIDEDVNQEISWSAQRDGTLKTMFLIDRFSSTWPAAASA